jgi:hypothetical protein
VETGLEACDPAEAGAQAAYAGAENDLAAGARPPVESAAAPACAARGSLERGQGASASARFGVAAAVSFVS